MRASTKVTLAGSAAAVALAAGSTLAIAAGTGSWHQDLTHQAAYQRGAGPSTTCSAPALPGALVDVTLSDMGARMGAGGGNMMRGGYGGMGSGGYGGMMRGGYNATGSGGWGPAGMMSVQVTPTSVPAGTVSLRASNLGAMTHELVVLPLDGDARPGQRTVGSDGTVDESGSLGEASNTCAAGEGDGIASGTQGWVTVRLAPGRYELVCNLPGHYAAGMYAELDVTA